MCRPLLLLPEIKVDRVAVLPFNAGAELSAEASMSLLTLPLSTRRVHVSGARKNLNCFLFAIASVLLLGMVRTIVRRAGLSELVLSSH